MWRALVLLGISLGALGDLLGMDCQTYKDRVEAAKKNQTLPEAHAYLQEVQRRNPDDPCVDYALGLYFKFRWQYDAALNHFRKARTINPSYYGSYVEIGWLSHAFRDYESARQSYDEAIRLAGQVNDPRGEIEAKIGLGGLYQQYGDLAKALRYLNEALQRSQSIRRPDYEANALVRMTWTLLSLGEIAEAESVCRRALQIRKALNDEKIWSVYSDLGDIHLKSGDAAADPSQAQTEYSKAIANYQQASTMTWAPSQKQRLLVLLGSAYLHSGDEDTALGYFQSFLAEVPAENRNFNEQRSQTLGSIGEIYLRRGRYDAALDSMEQAVHWAREDKNKRLEMSWIKRMGDVYARMGEYEKARHAYDTVLQTVRDGLLQRTSDSDEEKYGFFEEEFDVYEAMVDLLLKMDQRDPEHGYARAAFDYVERARAQSMLHVLFQSQIVSKLLQDPSYDARAKLAGLQAEVDAKHRARLALTERMRKQEPDEVDRLKNEIKRLEIEIQDLYKQIVALIKQKLTDLDTSQATHVVARIQTQVLHDGEALIEYMITDEKTFVFLITRDRFHCHVVPAGRRSYRVTRRGPEPMTSIPQLMRRVSPLFALPDKAFAKRPKIDVRGSDIQLRALRELYEVVFQPIESYLPAGSQLVIVPDDILYYLPFEMLVTGFPRRDAPEYLLSRYPISYAYAANLLLHRPTGSGSVPSRSLLIANPDFGPAKSPASAVSGDLVALRFFNSEKWLAPLPYTEEEVRRVRQVVKRPLTLLRAQATESAFKRNAGGADIIHIATHSVFNRLNYLDSNIVFALNKDIDQQGEDGFLYLHEIMNLSLKAQLVILTGCETGLGRLRRGGGLEGISRAFLSAGVPSVLGTLWPVADSEATSGLMAGFYQYLAQGKNKREALQKAKLDLMAEGRYIDPFYWAAPVVIGDACAVPLAKTQTAPRALLLISLPAFCLLLYWALARTMHAE